MSETHKPRHIRDIAHLYISRPRYRSKAEPVALWIAGENRGCFPGFHVANLAAAMAARDWSVEVLERSGLLPNALFYMALPPREYMGWDGCEQGPTPGLGRVTITMAPREHPEPRASNEPMEKGDLPVGPRLEITHLPPLHPEGPFQSGLGEMSVQPGAVTVFLALTMDDFFKSAGAASVQALGVTGWGVLHLGDTGHPSQTDDSTTFDLGNIGGWMGSLTDRVPVVVREPGSLLSRTYDSISDNLLFKVRQWRRGADADLAAGVSGGNRSGEHYSGSANQGTLLQVPRRHLRFSR